MPGQTACPTPRELEDFGMGKLPDTVVSAIAAHLDSCLACRQAVDELPTDSFLRQAKLANWRAGPTRPFQPEPNATTGDNPTTSAFTARPIGSERYALGDEIARGGMGVVHRATDTILGREVAVKVLQDRFAAESGVARRFADEARITAQLQHPGIPPIHDLGTLPDGRPFLAMKLIKGKTLDQLLRQRAESAADRGQLIAVFEQVCQAVGYAHAHDVIHRDLKPANVMVGAFGEVQIMDWGLAKVLTAGCPATGEMADQLATMAETAIRPSGDPEGATQAGSVLGTPAYMPPEQAIGAIDQIDKRSDVFGLGAVLCTILTGQPPYVGSDAESTRQLAARAKTDEALSRLNGCGAEPDLVALCKRCLAVEKNDRPADAGEVARAVAALRTAAEERARRAELDRVKADGERKRRRIWLGSAAALTLAAVGGLSAVLAVQRQANAELADEQAKVEARFDLAQKAIATFHTGVSEDMLLKNDQFKELRNKLLKEPARFYADLEKLLADKTDTRSRKLLASSYDELGKLTSLIGDKTEALVVNRKALALRRELAAAPGADVEARLDLAASLRAVGSDLYESDVAGALLLFKEMRDVAEALVAEAPSGRTRACLSRSYRGIGVELMGHGKLAQALEAFQKARDVYQKEDLDNPKYLADLADCHWFIGNMLSLMGKDAEAMPCWEKSRDIQQKLVDADPDNTDFLYALALSHNNIGLALLKPAEALTAFQKARYIQQKVVALHPAVTDFQRYLAIYCNNTARSFVFLGKPAEALRASEQSRDIQQKLVDVNPAGDMLQSELAFYSDMVGDALTRTGKPVDALHAHEKARDIHQKLVDAHPLDDEFQRALAGSCSAIGTVLYRTGKPAEALQAYRRALDIQQRLCDAKPANHADPTSPARAPSWFEAEMLIESDPARNQQIQASIQYLTGRVLAHEGRFEEAFALLNKAQNLYQQLIQADPKNARYVLRLGYSHAFRGAAHVRAGHPAEAAADLRRAVELWAGYKNPDGEDHFERARALALLAGLGSNAKSGVTKSESATFAGQAVTAVRDSLHAGWVDTGQLNEADFDSIRRRPDLQKVLKELEAKRP
jgi:tetratricopeptide (TPR) repeat protein